MNTSLSFTKSLLKRPEVTGAPNQTFSFAEDFGKAALKHIPTKTIVAIGTVTPGSTTLQYLFEPMFHHGLSGVQITIIGNSSNNKGEFSLIKIKISSFQFPPESHPKRTLTPFWHWQDLICVCSCPPVMRGVTVKHALTSTSSPPNDVPSIPWSPVVLPLCVLERFSNRLVYLGCRTPWQLLLGNATT
jgi:hypothetical protein